MRIRSIAVASLLFAIPLIAEDHFTIFVSDIGYQTGHTTTFDGTATPAVPVTQKTSEWTGGAGIAFDHDWNSRWATEGSIAIERRYTTGLRLENGIPSTERRRTETFPVDLMMRFRFPNDSRWTPYIAGGAHYVGAPDVVVGTLNPAASIGFVPVTLGRYSNRLSAQLGLGTTFRITPRVGLQFDVKRLLRSDQVFFDPLVRGSFGVNFRF